MSTNQMKRLKIMTMRKITLPPTLKQKVLPAALAISPPSHFLGSLSDRGLACRILFHLGLTPSYATPPPPPVAVGQT